MFAKNAYQKQIIAYRENPQVQSSTRPKMAMELMHQGIQKFLAGPVTAIMAWFGIAQIRWCAKSNHLFNNLIAGSSETNNLRFMFSYPQV